MNNKNKRNRNKKNKANKKAEDSDGDWEELLTAPLPNHEASADTAKGAKGVEESNENDWEDEDDDQTRATNDSTKANARQGDEDDGEDGAGKKKRKKRANKRTVAKLKEARRTFMERCVSPNYSRVSRLQLNGEINLTNLKHYFCSLPDSDAPYMNTRSKTTGGHPAGMVP